MKKKTRYNYFESKPLCQNGYTDLNLLALEKENELYKINNSIDVNNIINEWKNLDYCKNCVHYGYIDTYNLCADGSVWHLILNDLQAVSYSGWCKRFINRYSEQGKIFKYSSIKQKYLLKLGFEQEKVK